MIKTNRDDAPGEEIERDDPRTRGTAYQSDDADLTGAARQAGTAPQVGDRVEVRLAVGNDHAGVLAVGHRTWVATYEPITGPEYVAMGLAKWWTSDVVTDSIRKGRTLVAVEDGEVVGVATFGTQ